MKHLGLFIACSLAPMCLSSCVNPQHKVVYTVSGQASGQTVQIGYLDTPAYGRAEKSQLKFIRVQARSLPWSTTVYLPGKALTWLQVMNEDKRKSKLKTSVEHYGANGKLRSIGAGPPDAVTAYDNWGQVPDS